ARGVAECGAARVEVDNPGVRGLNAHRASDLVDETRPRLLANPGVAAQLAVGLSAQPVVVHFGLVRFAAGRGEHRLQPFAARRAQPFGVHTCGLRSEYAVTAEAQPEQKSRIREERPE